MGSTTTVETSDGVKLQVRVFNPNPNPTPNRNRKIAIVLVHPFTILGGSQALLRGIASNLAAKGYVAVTFNSRGAGRSTGRASLTGFAEIQDVIAVCKWVVKEESLNPTTDDDGGIVLVGSSAGAPIAGSAVDKIDQVVGYVSLGYPFGLTASILFGRHHEAILKSEKPKLFVMGTKDCFTSVKQLEKKLKTAAGRVESHLLQGVGHFQMEGPAYDEQMSHLIDTFVRSL